MQPSVFSHQILNAMPYAFLDDAPLEERRARAVTLRRALPDDARDLAALDPEALREESANAWPAIRDADELHDALLTLGVIPETELWGRSSWASQDMLLEWLRQLAQAGRSLRLTLPSGKDACLAAEHATLVGAAYPDADIERLHLATPRKTVPAAMSPALRTLTGELTGKQRRSTWCGVGRVLRPLHRR